MSQNTARSRVRAAIDQIGAGCFSENAPSQRAGANDAARPAGNTNRSGRPLNSDRAAAPGARDRFSDWQGHREHHEMKSTAPPHNSATGDRAMVTQLPTSLHWQVELSGERWRWWWRRQESDGPVEACSRVPHCLMKPLEHVLR